MSYFNEKSFRRGIYLCSLIIGFFLGGYIRSKGTKVIGLTISDFIGILFSSLLIYFSWIQNRYINMQYELSLDRSKPSIDIEFDHNRKCIHLKNVGERTAYDIKCRLRDWTNDEPHEYRDIEEIFANCSELLYFPIDWRNKKNCEIEINVEYYTGKETRRSQERIEYEYEYTRELTVKENFIF